MKVRIISAFIAILILIPFVYIGGLPFLFIISIIGIQAYKEMLDLKVAHQEIPNIARFLGLVALLYLIMSNYNGLLIPQVLSFSKVLIPILLVLLPTVFYDKNKYTTQDALYMLGFIYLIGFFFNLIVTIRNNNLYLLLYLLCIAVMTDTFAYSIGSLIGKHKMSLISPNKSWEGSIAGLIGGTITSLIVYQTLINPISIKIVIVTIVLSVVGQLGDLFFSKIKRENDIKDFSNIMPGHGGILDRIDSLSFITFAYVAIMWFI